MQRFREVRRTVSREVFLIAPRTIILTFPIGCCIYLFESFLSREAPLYWVTNAVTRYPGPVSYVKRISLEISGSRSAGSAMRSLPRSPARLCWSEKRNSANEQVQVEREQNRLTLTVASADGCVSVGFSCLVSSRSPFPLILGVIAARFRESLWGLKQQQKLRRSQQSKKQQFRAIFPWFNQFEAYRAMMKTYL